MSGAESIPAEAVQAACDAIDDVNLKIGSGHPLNEAEAALAAALPHMEPLIRADERRRLADWWARYFPGDRSGTQRTLRLLAEDGYPEEATDGR